MKTLAQLLKGATVASYRFGILCNSRYDCKLQELDGYDPYNHRESRTFTK